MGNVVDGRLVDTLGLIGSTDGHDDLAVAVSVAVGERSPGLAAAVLQLDPSSETLRVVAADRLPSLVIDDLPLGRAGGAIGRAVLLGETVLAPSPWADSGDTTSVMAVAPVTVDGEPCGAVLALGEDGAIDDGTLLHLEACAQLLGLVAGRARPHPTSVSAETGLPDRSAAAALLAQARSRSGGLGGTFVTVAVDVTGGPDARRVVAADLAAAMRATDHIFDIGHGRLLMVSGHLSSAGDAVPIAARLGSAAGARASAVGAVVHRAPIEPDRVLDRISAARTAPVGATAPAPVTDLSGLDETHPIAVDEIERDLQAGRILPWYQPVVSIPDGRVVGAEALARWHHLDGVRTPDTFVPVLESTGRVSSLTDAILLGALTDLAAWRRDGLVDDDFTVSVNVSGDEVGDPDFAERVRAALDESGCAPASLRIELTETVPLGDRVAAIRVLGELRESGISVAIDDFGTGHATFTSLRSLPVDVVKIDRSFVQSLPDRSSETVVRSVVDLAAVLDLVIVAEGVEEAPHLEFLRDAGVHEAQGWFFARPVPATDLPGTIEALHHRSGAAGSP